jgi:hypothetical protein
MDRSIANLSSSTLEVWGLRVENQLVIIVVPNIAYPDQSAYRKQGGKCKRSAIWVSRLVLHEERGYKQILKRGDPWP